jgi:hypothetical protein
LDQSRAWLRRRLRVAMISGKGFLGYVKALRRLAAL